MEVSESKNPVPEENVDVISADEGLGVSDVLNIDFITQKSQKKMKVSEKCDLIVDHVRNGRILFWEGGIDSPTELKLIERSMAEIDHDEFLGLEIFSPNKSIGKKRMRKESKITIITPAFCDVRFRTI